MITELNVQSPQLGSLHRIGDRVTWTIDGEPEERLDERRFRLADVARHEKASFIYEYDFGDSWAHEVVVEKILPADPKKKYAVCLDGKNACPPEDCGGIWGYYELLKVVKKPKHKEHQATPDWLGGPVDPGPLLLLKNKTSLPWLGAF